MVTIKNGKRNENATAQGVPPMNDELYGDRLISETTLEKTRIFERRVT